MHRSAMKKRQMLQTRNFMNMTMAQMVSDPHHYQASNNINQNGLVRNSSYKFR